MSWLIVGTIPHDDFPLTEATCSIENRALQIEGCTVPVNRGTPALIAAATVAAGVLGVAPPRALLAGDTGKGLGSEKIYRHLVENMQHRSDTLVVFHYLQPDLDWHNRIMLSLEELRDRPTLVADAGYMYVAKMSGLAPSYDLFTPDMGELAFLADESAPHPFYTRGFLLQEENRAEELIHRAYEHENAAQQLLVKGRCDLVASADGILEQICEPCVENMEPIGGTGDTLTGIAAALIHAGRPIDRAAALAARTNRLMGLMARVTPSSSVADLMPFLPQALSEVLAARESGAHESSVL